MWPAFPATYLEVLDIMISNDFSMDPVDTTELPPNETTDLDTQVIPLLEEQLQVGKRIVETGTVRLYKQVEERSEVVDMSLERVHYEVSHVPCNIVVAEAPLVRQEGDTIIYPVLEERLVVSRQWVLVEEVHVTRSSTITQQPATYTLKRERLVEERS